MLESIVFRREREWIYSKHCGRSLELGDSAVEVECIASIVAAILLVVDPTGCGRCLTNTATPGYRRKPLQESLDFSMQMEKDAVEEAMEMGD